MTDPMKISENGLALIREHEGFRAGAYQDTAGILTVGYGHTGKVSPEEVLTPPAADALLREDVRVAERVIHRYVTVPLSQGQFDALVSFIFNLGEGHFVPSTLLKKLNAGDIPGAADEFLRWDNAGGHEVAGLKARRQAERALFLS